MNRFRLWLVIVLVAGAGCYCRAAEQQETKDPPALTNLRAQYTDALKDVVQPIQRKYVQQLEALVKQLGAAGKIEDASLVQKELQDVTAELAAGKNTVKTNSKVKSFLGKWIWHVGLVEILANHTLTTQRKEVFKWDPVDGDHIRVFWGQYGGHLVTFAPDRQTCSIVRENNGETYSGTKVEDSTQSTKHK